MLWGFCLSPSSVCLALHFIYCIYFDFIWADQLEAAFPYLTIPVFLESSWEAMASPFQHSDLNTALIFRSGGYSSVPTKTPPGSEMTHILVIM